MTLFSLAQLWFDDKLTLMQLKNELKMITIIKGRPPKKSEYFNSWESIVYNFVTVGNIEETQYYKFKEHVETLVDLNKSEHIFLEKYLEIEHKIRMVPTEITNVIKQFKSDELSLVEAMNTIYNTPTDESTWLSQHENEFALAYIFTEK